MNSGRTEYVSTRYSNRQCGVKQGRMDERTICANNGRAVQSMFIGNIIEQKVNKNRKEFTTSGLCENEIKTLIYKYTNGERLDNSKKCRTNASSPNDTDQRLGRLVEQDRRAETISEWQEKVLTYFMISLAAAPCIGLPTTAALRNGKHCEPDFWNRVGRDWALIVCMLFVDQMDWREVVVGDTDCWSIAFPRPTGAMFSVLDTLLAFDDFIWLDGGFGWMNKQRWPYGQMPEVVYFSQSLVLYLRWLRICGLNDDKIWVIIERDLLGRAQFDFSVSELAVFTERALHRLQPCLNRHYWSNAK